MKIEKPKRYYKKVSYGDGLPLVFCYRHLPLIQKILDLKDNEVAIALGIPIHKLRRTLQQTEALPERINSGMNSLLIQKFETANIGWIALNTWVNEDWGRMEVCAEGNEFYCRFFHLQSGFGLYCGASTGFCLEMPESGAVIDGTYGFSQVNAFFNVIDEMIKVDPSQWLEFWEQAQVARKADLEQKIAARAAASQALQDSSEKGDRRKIKMTEMIAAMEKEASEGGADAKYSAGRALAMGLNMEQPDLEKAAYWLALATADGHFQAGKLLTQVKKIVFERSKTLQ